LNQALLILQDGFFRVIVQQRVVEPTLGRDVRDFPATSTIALDRHSGEMRGPSDRGIDRLTVRLRTGEVRHRRWRRGGDGFCLERRDACCPVRPAGGGGFIVSAGVLAGAGMAVTLRPVLGVDAGVVHTLCARHCNR